MAQTYFAILTAIGEAKLANATALGTMLQLTKMAVGDGNGATPIPNRNQTALVHENRRAPLNTLFVDPANASQIIAEQIIPEDIGDWWIREIGLYDAAGDLCAVANCPDTYKPVLSSGSGRTQIIRMVLIVANTSSVELKIDPSVVLAPRSYVDQVMAGHLAAADPHPQYAKRATTLAGYNISDGIPVKITEIKGMDLDTLPTGVYSYSHGNQANQNAPVGGPQYGILECINNGLFTLQRLTCNISDEQWARCVYHGGNRSVPVGPWVKMATVQSVDAAIAALVNSSPAALNTLNELAVAIGNDANFAATMTNALALKAPLASPTFTGTPTAPTPAAGSNTTQVATSAFVQSAIASLVASSPAALNTLNELAAAIGNDANFAATMTNALALKASKSSVDYRTGTAGGFTFRNRLINAAGTINQRAYSSGTATVSANQYTVDRWRVVVPAQSLSWVANGVGVTFTAPAGGVEQVIEGANIEGGSYTLSWIGTATAKVNGTAVANGGTVSLPANTNATVTFVGGTFAFPQFEMGTVNTTFELRPVQVELALCQRYFQNYSGMLVVGITNSFNNSAIKILPVEMRAIPAITQTTAGTGITWASMSTKAIGPSGMNSVEAITTKLWLDSEL